MYQDYAATSTGVGNQQLSELRERTRHAFIWSLFELILGQTASQDRVGSVFKQMSRKGRSVCLASRLRTGFIDVVGEIKLLRGIYPYEWHQKRHGCLFLFFLNGHMTINKQKISNYKPENSW